MKSFNYAVNAELRHRIESIIHEHAWLIDQNQADRLHELYASNGKMLGVGMELDGKEAIRKYGVERVKMTGRKARHLCSNLRISPVDAEHVQGNFMITLYRHEGEGLGDATPVAIADITDTYVVGGDGRLLIEQRRIDLAFESEGHRKTQKKAA